LFDTANPGSEKNGGDPDLGAPNKNCSPPGPGKGLGGEPGALGENCNPLGNVLIIQEPGVDVPDDNRNGGIITLDFPLEGGQYVDEIGLLDIDYAMIVVVVYEDENGTIEEDTLDVPLLGNNSKQVLDINQERVRWIKVMFGRSGAVTHIKFCPKEAMKTSSSTSMTPQTGAPLMVAPPRCPKVDKPCMNDENFRVCTELVNDGCTVLLVLKSCPLQFRCGDPTPEPTMSLPTSAPSISTLTAKPSKSLTR
jgi:hypothetical protein